MKYDATIRVRFRTTIDGGRKSNIQKGKVNYYSCPMLIGKLFFDCRIYFSGESIILGELYELGVKFLNANEAHNALRSTKRVSLWEGHIIADGEVAICE
jgi:hypothetical protein